MKYRSAAQILPEELIREIQKYVQGEYIYIPIGEKAARRSPTGYSTELHKRDERIYKMHLEGLTSRRLSDIFHLSGSSIRRIISRQKEHYAAMKENIKSILKHWKLADEKITQIYHSAWQIGEHYILKVYEGTAMLERNIRILSGLHSQGIPVGAIIPTQDGCDYVSDADRHYLLCEKLPGSNLVSLKQFPGLAREMGRIIARLHNAFRSLDGQINIWDNSLQDEMQGWVAKIFRDREWTDISEETFRQVTVKLERLYDQLPRQLIHRDVHFGNFLFDGGDFCGYIDFDLSQRNIRIFDLCYFVIGLLSEEEKLEIDTEMWFRSLAEVFSGYQEILSLSRVEKQAVPWVMASIELLFTAWFYSQDDHICAEDAMKLFHFAEENADRILNSI